MEEFPALAAFQPVAFASVASYPVSRLIEPSQLLGVDVDQLTSVFPLLPDLVVMITTPLAPLAP